MIQTLRYGTNGKFDLDLPEDVIRADCTVSRAKPLDDPAAAIAVALADPIDFPPLSQATVPDDQVAIVVTPGLPQMPTLVAGVVHTLVEQGTDPADITILLAPDFASDPYIDPVSQLPAEFKAKVDVVTHDPDNSDAVSYLAASREGHPIYISRIVYDSDVVVPIGTLRLDPNLGPPSVNESLFPAFSDRKTMERLRQGDRESSKITEEVDEAIWLLGVQFTIQVIPGPGDTVLNVLAGDCNAVASRGKSLCESAWRFNLPDRASLVVATIDGGPQQQTWENFVRALSVASHAVEDNGAIVICSELKRTALPVASPVGAETSEFVSDQPSSAAETAEAVISKSCNNARVFLLSDLKSDVVEDLGIAYVAKPDEVIRLSRQHDSCILVSSAQHAVLVAEDQ